MLYVDDLFLTDEEKIITYYKKNISSEFEMKDLHPMQYLLGLEVWKILGEIFFNPRKYDVEIMKRLDMMDSKSMSTLWRRI
jgi:hypothetical protein